MVGKNLLKDGIFWRAGNGKSVRTWKHRWIPRRYCHRGQSNITDLGEDAKVVDLIDANLKWWNENLLIKLFTPQEVDMIKSIPINIGEERINWYGITPRMGNSQ